MSKQIVLKCQDHKGASFELDEAVAVQMKVIKEIYHPDFEGQNHVEIKLPEKFSSYIIKAIIKYCKKQAKAKDNEEDLKYCDYWFASEYRKPNARMRKELIEIMQAAAYLGVEKLVDVTCEIVADLIRQQRSLAVRPHWKIQGDNTPEEEAKAVARGKDLGF